jgi:hypothetical protein
MNDVEQEKTLYAHKLDVRKLVIDKLLIGALLIIVGFAANFTIEQYRARSTKERFLLEKKLEAMQLINQDYFSMHQTFISLAQKEDLIQGHYTLLNKKLNSFISVWTNNNVISSTHFSKQMEYMTWLYTALFKKDLANMRVYRVFFFDVYATFNSLVREEMGFPRNEGDVSFDFVEWAKEQAELKGVDKYLDENFEKWQSTK